MSNLVTMNLLKGRGLSNLHYIKPKMLLLFFFFSGVSLLFSETTALLTVTSETSSWTNDKYVDYSWSATDSEELIEVKVFAGLTKMDSISLKGFKPPFKEYDADNQGFTVSANGEIEIKVVVNGKSQAFNAKDTATVYLDDKDPSAKVSPISGATVSDTSKEITIWPSDAHSGVKSVSVDGANVEKPEKGNAWKYKVSNLTTGENSFNIKVTDNAGNEGNIIYKLKYKYDNIKPTVSFTDMNSSWQSSSNPVINFKASDDKSGLESILLQYKSSTDTTWNDIKTFSYSGELEITENYNGKTFDSDGVYSLQLVATDKSDNVQTSSLGSVYIDTTKPEVSNVSTGVTGIVPSKKVTISIEASDPTPGSGVEKLIATNNGKSFTATHYSGTTYKVDITNLTIGNNSISIIATDNAGNVSDSKSVTVISDPPPEVVITSIKTEAGKDLDIINGNYRSYSDEINISGQVIDDSPSGQVVTLKINGKNVSLTNKKFNKKFTLKRGEVDSLNTFSFTANDGRTDSAPVKRSIQYRKKWTMLSYGNYDSNLPTTSYTDDLELFSKVVDPSWKNNADVLFMYDGNGTNDTKMQYCVPGTKTNLTNKLSSTEQNMASSDTLVTFLNYGVSRYPADHYLVHFGDHGYNWKGHSVDITSEDIMTLTEFQAALTSVQTNNDNIMFDIAVFDECTMAVAEVAQLMSSYFNYMVASQEIAHAYYYQWDELLEPLSRVDSSAETETFLKLIIKKFKDKHSAKSSRNLAAINLNSFRGIIDDINSLGQSLRTEGDTYYPWINNIREKTVERMDHTRRQYVSNGIKYAVFLADLFDFSKLIVEENNFNGSTIKDHAQAIYDQKDNVILSHYANDDMPNATGLAIYFPVFPSRYEKEGYVPYNDYLKNGEDKEFVENYVDIPFCDDNVAKEWQKFIIEDITPPSFKKLEKVTADTSITSIGDFVQFKYSINYEKKQRSSAKAFIKFSLVDTNDTNVSYILEDWKRVYEGNEYKHYFRGIIEDSGEKKLIANGQYKLKIELRDDKYNFYKENPGKGVPYYLSEALDVNIPRREIKNSVTTTKNRANIKIAVPEANVKYIYYSTNKALNKLTIGEGLSNQVINVPSGVSCKVSVSKSGYKTKTKDFKTNKSEYVEDTFVPILNGATGYDPNMDSDKDGLPDGWEFRYWQYLDPWTIDCGLNLSKKDSDNNVDYLYTTKEFKGNYTGHEDEQINYKKTDGLTNIEEYELQKIDGFNYIDPRYTDLLVELDWVVSDNNYKPEKIAKNTCTNIFKNSGVKLFWAKSEEHSNPISVTSEVGKATTIELSYLESILSENKGKYNYTNIGGDIDIVQVVFVPGWTKISNSDPLEGLSVAGLYTNKTPSTSGIFVFDMNTRNLHKNQNLKDMPLDSLYKYEGNILAHELGHAIGIKEKTGDKFKSDAVMFHDNEAHEMVLVGDRKFYDDDITQINFNNLFSLPGPLTDMVSFAPTISHTTLLPYVMDPITIKAYIMDMDNPISLSPNEIDSSKKVFYSITNGKTWASKEMTYFEDEDLISGDEFNYHITLSNDPESADFIPDQTKVLYYIEAKDNKYRVTSPECDNFEDPDITTPPTQLYNFVVDRTPPSITFDSERGIFSPNGDKVEDSIIINYHVSDISDFVTGVTASIYSPGSEIIKSWPVLDYLTSPGSNTIEWEGTKDLQEGIYSLKVEAKDRPKNKGTAQHSVIVDLTPPTVFDPEILILPDSSNSTFTSLGEGIKLNYKVYEKWTSRVSAHITFVSGATSVTKTQEIDVIPGEDKKVEYIWDGKDNEGHIVPQGEYLGHIVVVDEVGNKSLEIEIPGILIDCTPATVDTLYVDKKLFSPDQIPLTSENNVNLYYDLSEAADIVINVKNSSGKVLKSFNEEFKKSGSIVWNGKVKDKFVSDGIYVFELITTDTAGNTAKGEVSIIKNRVPAKITFPVNSSSVDNTCVIKGIAVDPGIINPQDFRSYKLWYREGANLDYDLPENNPVNPDTEFWNKIAVPTIYQDHTDTFYPVSNKSVKTVVNTTLGDWDTLDLADDTKYTVLLVAEDEAGNISYDSVWVNVDKGLDNNKPIVKINQPITGKTFSKNTDEENLSVLYDLAMDGNKRANLSFNIYIKNGNDYGEIVHHEEQFNIEMSKEFIWDGKNYFKNLYAKNGEYILEVIGRDSDNMGLSKSVTTISYINNVDQAVAVTKFLVDKSKLIPGQETNITYSISEDANVTIKVMDINNKVISVLMENQYISGNSVGTLSWVGDIEGLYSCEIKAESTSDGTTAIATENIAVSANSGSARAEISYPLEGEEIKGNTYYNWKAKASGNYYKASEFTSNIKVNGKKITYDETTFDWKLRAEGIEEYDFIEYNTYSGKETGSLGSQFDIDEYRESNYQRIQKWYYVNADVKYPYTFYELPEPKIISSAGMDWKITEKRKDGFKAQGWIKKDVYWWKYYDHDGKWWTPKQEYTKEEWSPCSAGSSYIEWEIVGARSTRKRRPVVSQVAKYLDKIERFEDVPGVNVKRKSTKTSSKPKGKSHHDTKENYKMYRNDYWVYFDIKYETTFKEKPEPNIINYTGYDLETYDKKNDGFKAKMWVKKVEKWWRWYDHDGNPMTAKVPHTDIKWTPAHTDTAFIEWEVNGTVRKTWKEDVISQTPISQTMALKPNEHREISFDLVLPVDGKLNGKIISAQIVAAQPGQDTYGFENSNDYDNKDYIETSFSNHQRKDNVISVTLKAINTKEPVKENWSENIVLDSSNLNNWDKNNLCYFSNPLASKPLFNFYTKPLNLAFTSPKYQVVDISNSDVTARIEGEKILFSSNVKDNTWTSESDTKLAANGGYIRSRYEIFNDEIYSHFITESEPIKYSESYPDIDMDTAPDILNQHVFWKVKGEPVKNNPHVVIDSYKSGWDVEVLDPQYRSLSDSENPFTINQRRFTPPNTDTEENTDNPYDLNDQFSVRLKKDGSVQRYLKIRGKTATVEDGFIGYSLYYKKAGGTVWSPILQSNEPVKTDGILGFWNITRLNGIYTIKLVVLDSSGIKEVERNISLGQKVEPTKDTYVTAPGNKAYLKVPAGSVANKEMITISPVNKNDLGYQLDPAIPAPIGQIYKMEPAGLKFNPNKPAWLNIRFLPEELEGIDIGKLNIYHINEDGSFEVLGIPLPTQEFSDDEHSIPLTVISCPVTSFSSYMIISGILPPVLDPISSFNNSSVTLTGKSEPNSIVEIFNNSSSVGQVKTLGNGSFSIDISLIEGNNLISATAKRSFAKGFQVSENSNVLEILLDSEAPQISGVKTSPNPFFPEGSIGFDKTKIEFLVSEPVKLNITILAASGRKVRSLVNNRNVEAGEHIYSWDGKDDSSIIQGSGTYEFLIEAFDNAGNKVEKRTEIDIRDDVEAPVTTMFIGKPNYLDEAQYITSKTKIVLKGIDSNNESDIKFVRYRRNGSSWITSKNDEVSFYIEGLDREHVIEYQSEDIAGNREDIKLTRLQLDNSAPNTQFKYGEPLYHNSKKDRIISASTTIFCESISTDVANTYYSIDNGDYQIGESFTVQGLSDGEHNLKTYSVDKLGNIEIEVSESIIIDNSAPETTIHSNQEYFVLDKNLYVTRDNLFTTTSIDNYCEAKIYLEVDGNIFENPDPIKLEDGEHIFKYYAIDSLGNKESVKQLTVNVPLPDQTAPVTTLNTSYPPYLNNEVKYFRSDCEFSLEAEDVIGGTDLYVSGVESIYYSIDSGPLYLYEKSFKVDTEGEHKIFYYSVDKFNNVENIQSYEFIIDNTAPISEVKIQEEDLFVSYNNKLTLSESQSIAIIATDDYSGVKNVYFRLSDEDEWNNYASPINLEDGIYTLSYFTEDNLLNKSETVNVDVLVIEDYNIVSYKTYYQEENSRGNIKAICSDRLAYIDGNGSLMLKELDSNSPGIEKLTTTNSKVMSISFNGNYIAYAQQENQGSSIYLYNTKGMYNSLITSYGNNSKPILIGNYLYYLEERYNESIIHKFSISGNYEVPVYSSGNKIIKMKKDNEELAFVESTEDSFTINKIIDDKVSTVFTPNNDGYKIVDFSLRGNHVVFETSDKVDNILLYQLDGDVLSHLYTVTGSSATLYNTNLLFISHEGNKDDLVQYNFINHTSNSLMQGNSIIEYDIDNSGNILVNREFIANSFNNQSVYFNNYYPHSNMKLTQDIYLKNSSKVALVEDIEIDNGDKNNYVFNKHFDDEDYIYIGDNSTYHNIYGTDYKLQQIQTYNRSQLDVDSQTIRFKATKDIQVVVVQDSNGEYVIDNWIEQIVRQYLNMVMKSNNGLKVSYYEVASGEELILENVATTKDFTPFVFIKEKKDDPHFLYNWWDF